MDRLQALVNDFAVRSFRDTADLDYINARLSHRHRLIPQFLWSGLQAIEKYLKCILLLNRIEAKNVSHDLAKALTLARENLPFTIHHCPASQAVIDHLDTYGRFRYLDVPLYTMGHENLQLDQAVWDIRRYCQVLSYPNPKTNESMLEIELRRLDEAVSAPQRFRIAGGLLEKILGDRTHPAREALVKHNLFFGPRQRSRVPQRFEMHATNSPLFLHPELIDEVEKYVYINRLVAADCRNRLSPPR